MLLKKQNSQYESNSIVGFNRSGVDSLNSPDIKLSRGGYKSNGSSGSNGSSYYGTPDINRSSSKSFKQFKSPKPSKLEYSTKIPLAVLDCLMEREFENCHRITPEIKGQLLPQKEFLKVLKANPEEDKTDFIIDWIRNNIKKPL